MKKILNRIFQFNERKVVFSIVFIIFIFCTAIHFLGYYYQNKHYPGQWFLFFSEISQKNLDFEIKNNSSENKFYWVLTSGKNKKIDKGEVFIESDSTQKIQPSVDFSILQGGKWTIVVTDLQGKKIEIYKRF